MNNLKNGSTNGDNAESNKFLCFSLGSQEYGIPLLTVKEVIALPEFTPIPFSPPYFSGIMNLRGMIISGLDLRKKFNIKPTETAETSVIVCDLGPICIGIVVDSINSVLDPHPSELSAKPETQAQSDFVTNVYNKNNKLVLMIDIAMALNIDDKRVLNQATLNKAA